MSVSVSNGQFDLAMVDLSPEKSENSPRDRTRNRLLMLINKLKQVGFNVIHRILCSNC